MGGLGPAGSSAAHAGELLTLACPFQKKPFHSVQGLSSEEKGQARTQKIPTLQQVLQEAKQHNVSIMFDLRPENHTDYQSFVNVTVETILQSGILPQLVSLALPLESDA